MSRVLVMAGSLAPTAPRRPCDLDLGDLPGPHGHRHSFRWETAGRILLLVRTPTTKRGTVMTAATRRLWLTAGWLLIGFVVLTFVGVTFGTSATIGDTQNNITKSLVTSS